MPELCIKKNEKIYKYPFYPVEFPHDIAAQCIKYKHNGKIYTLPMTQYKETGRSGILAIKRDSTTYYPIYPLYHGVIQSKYFRQYTFDDFFNSIKPYFPSSGTVRFIIPKKLDSTPSQEFPYYWQWASSAHGITAGLVAIKLEWAEKTSNSITTLENRAITFYGIRTGYGVEWNYPDSWTYDTSINDKVFEFEIDFDFR